MMKLDEFIDEHCGIKIRITIEVAKLTEKDVFLSKCMKKTLVLSRLDCDLNFSSQETLLSQVQDHWYQGQAVTLK